MHREIPIIMFTTCSNFSHLPLLWSRQRNVHWMVLFREQLHHAVKFMSVGGVSNKV